jgi:hypothetical protein
VAVVLVDTEDQVIRGHMGQVHKGHDQAVVHHSLVEDTVQVHYMGVVLLADTAQNQHYLVVGDMEYGEGYVEDDSL